jgi:hypothetical protein
VWLITALDYAVRVVPLSPSASTSVQVPSPSPTSPPASPASEIARKVLENVLTNLFTVVVIPLLIPTLCLMAGFLIHVFLGDMRDWWASIREFRSLAANRKSGALAAVRYWLSLLQVLLTGRLTDTAMLDKSDEQGRPT